MKSSPRQTLYSSISSVDLPATSKVQLQKSDTSTMFANQPILQLQKKLGNQSIAHILQSPTNLQRDSQSFLYKADKDYKETYSPIPVIQKVSDNADHFQQFVEACANGKTVDTNDLLVVKACAYILDHHSYKEKHKDLPSMYDSVLGHIPSSGVAQDYLNIVNEFANYMGHTTSKITWGSISADGIGTSVHVVFGKDGHAQGSPTGATTPWMDTLYKRKDGTKTLYVMGHLLNADLGGPGLDYNYVPLPGRAGWYGANDANSLHSNGIEQIVKTKYSMLGKGVDSLEYAVKAINPREPRIEQINQMIDAVKEMDKIAPELGDSDRPLRLLDNDKKTILKDFIQKNPNLQSILYAVSSGNYFFKSWDDLTQAVKENAELWVIEDRYVPRELKTFIKWTQHGTAQDLQLTIPIHLPTSLAAPYNSNKVIKQSKSEPIAHKSQFIDYVSKYGKSLAPDVQKETYTKHAARLMDLNEYDRDMLHELLENIQQFHNIETQLKSGLISEKERAELVALRARYEDAFTILSSDPDIQNLAKSEADVHIVMELLQKSSGDLLHFIRNYIKEVRPDKPLSEFFSSGKTPWGSPSTIVAHLQKDGHPQGSSAGGDSSWMLNLEERRDDSKTLYVRGHMLNRHLGGAGLDHNMVPLTGRAGWYGANNANGLHSSGIEEIVKNLYYKLADPGEVNPAKVTNLVYTIEAIFGDHARPQTTTIKNLTIYYENDIFQTILSKYETQNKSLDAGQHKDKFTTLSTEKFVDLANKNLEEAILVFIQRFYIINKSKYGEGKDPSIDPLKNQIINDFDRNNLDSSEKMIAVWKHHIAAYEYDLQTPDVSNKIMAWSDITKNFSQPIASLPPENRDWIIGKVNAAENLKVLLNAVSLNGDYLFLNILELRDSIKANLELWYFEDHNVPLGLRTHVKYDQEGSTKEGAYQVQNILPSDIGAPYQSRDE